MTDEDDCDKPEWGGWKIVSDMLDNTDMDGIYPTSKCYRELFEFVVAQEKAVAHEILDEIENYLPIVLTGKITEKPAYYREADINELIDGLRKKYLDAV